jgi:hypothetical protein
MRGLDWLWLGVPVVGLVELGAHLYFAGCTPREAEWRDLKPAVEQLRQHDELVVVAPDWAEPLARQALGDGLMPVVQVARPDESAYPRAIEISLLGQRTRELRDWNQVAVERVGRFRLRVLENPAPASTRFDFVSGLAPGRVVVQDGTPPRRRPCPYRGDHVPVAGGLHGSLAFPAARFDCGGGDQFVGVTIVEDDRYRPHRCIWAPPPEAGTRVIRYHDVPLGARIRGHTATSWFLMRDRDSAPIEVTIRVGGTVVGTVTHQDAGSWTSWHPFDFALGESANQRTDVVFEVRSADPANRQFCFQAETG